MKDRQAMQSVSTGNHHTEGIQVPGSSSQKEILLIKLVGALGGSYSSELGINLASLQSDEVFKWFLASMLLGVNNRQRVAIRAYREFEKAGVLSLERLLTTDWQSLVDTLDRGGYVMYNFKTATGLIEAAWTLNQQYQGDLNRLHFFTRDEKDLERRLRALGERVTPTVVKVFLRDMRGLWEKAEPPLEKDVLLALKRLQLADTTSPVLAMEELRIRWEDSGINQTQFSVLENALTKLGKSYCRKMKCDRCPVKTECQAGL
jgi:endonuclease III